MAGEAADVIHLASWFFEAYVVDLGQVGDLDVN